MRCRGPEAVLAAGLNEVDAEAGLPFRCALDLKADLDLRAVNVEKRRPRRVGQVLTGAIEFGPQLDQEIGQPDAVAVFVCHDFDRTDQRLREGKSVTGTRSRPCSPTQRTADGPPAAD